MYPHGIPLRARPVRMAAHMRNPVGSVDLNTRAVNR